MQLPTPRPFLALLFLLLLLLLSPSPLVRAFHNGYEPIFFLDHFWSMYNGFRIQDSDVDAAVRSHSHGACRMACFTTQCSTVSATPVPGDSSSSSFDCRLSFKPIHALSLYPADGAIAFAKDSALEYFKGIDGLFYVDGGGLGDPLHGNRDKCETKHLNRRIPILKTMKQFNSYWAFRNEEDLPDHKYSRVDLVYSDFLKTFVWPDNTTLEDTEVGKHILLLKREDDELNSIQVKNGEDGYYLEPVKISKKLTPVCQIDPFIN